MRKWGPAVALVLTLGGVQPLAAQQAGGRGGGAGGPPSSGSGGRPAGSMPGDAGHPAPGAGPVDAETVRDAVADGRSVPYSKVLAAVSAVVKGMVVDVAILPEAANGLAYDVKVLTPEGTLRDVLVDARGGTVRAVR